MSFLNDIKNNSALTYYIIATIQKKSYQGVILYQKFL